MVRIYLHGPLKVCRNTSYLVIRGFKSVVQTEELANRLPDLDPNKYRLLFCGLKQKESFRERRIQNSLYFDLDVCRDHDSPFRNTVPPADHFSKYVGTKLGISNDSHLVLYGSDMKNGYHWATRAWFLFHLFGHSQDKLSMLDGGLEKWVRELWPVASGEGFTRKSAKYVTEKRSKLLVDFDAVSEFSKNRDENQPVTLIDARGEDSYSGKKASFDYFGHIPGAVSFPADSLIEKNDDGSKTFKSIKDVEKEFNRRRISKDTPLWVSCGTGVSATAIMFYAKQLGMKDIRLYDGSWCEWTRKGGTAEKVD